MDCGVFGGWPYLAYQYIKKTVSHFRYIQWNLQRMGTLGPAMSSFVEGKEVPLYTNEASQIKTLQAPSCF